MAISVRKEATIFPRKTVFFDTGLVNRGVMLPVSNSPDIVFIVVATAIRKMNIPLNVLKKPETASGLGAKVTPLR